VARSVEESNKLSAAQWGHNSMEVLTEVQVDFIKRSNRNVVQYFRDFYLRVGTCLEDSGRHLSAP
jgi:sulfur relay (sulfurtransferase) DsrC/TusE family protein